MRLDDYIAHVEEIAEANERTVKMKNGKVPSYYRQRACEYRQLAEWLKELKRYKEDKPQGKWIEYKPEHGKCPFCGNTVDLLDGKLHRYCGECGTKMGEEQE